MDDPKQMERELTSLGAMFAERFNKLAEALEKGEYRLIPSLERLEEIEAFARSLTRDYPWTYAPPHDRRSMAEVRCVVSDAVWYAQQLDYASAAKCVQRAMHKLIHVRDRARTGRNRVMSPEMAGAIEDASAVMTDVMALFMEAEKEMVGSNASRAPG